LMGRQPSGTVTLVFTDIEGSTRLLHELGQEAYREALTEHRRVVREAFARHQGYEVDYEGDAFLYAFGSAADAVSAVSEARAGLDGGPIRIRVGVHTGEPGLDPPREGVIEPKSAAGRRRVPIVFALRGHIAAHRLARGSSGGLFFGEWEQPFNRGQLLLRAEKAWRRAGLGRIGLHEARHTCASIMIAAGVNLKALSSYLGHSSITITLDRYGHLLPGNEGEAVDLIDAYLERECEASSGMPL
jgi:hypothetical protein